MTGVPTALPAPRPRDPASVPALRWGVLGTGWIAQRFTAALQRSTRQVVHAVGSRDEASARRFADAAAARGVFCAEAVWTLFLPRRTPLTPSVRLSPVHGAVRRGQAGAAQVGDGPAPSAPLPRSTGGGPQDVRDRARGSVRIAGG